ncbi:hypothetical protein BCR33DRAFT_10874 [Rhizoclosmatium globosum]|uniref:Uncharacterized protein n=1 Tax=Rhizoclosmatium globosum TaxID=329046 RepID=A0A1Y2D404_9FUNG|nr:hypothetical protein BCR33DRAFT_10874 [Rhizoclosmatium globosum]|eukprot:ORY53884.1 hypothetical protein BCR33DRAFT_10874 [Rhizoclosmatium globosum]
MSDQLSPQHPGNWQYPIPSDSSSERQAQDAHQSQYNQLTAYPVPQAPDSSNQYTQQHQPLPSIHQFYHQTQHQTPTQIVQNQPHQSYGNPIPFQVKVPPPNDTILETFYGFVKDETDAKILVEACIQKVLPLVKDAPLTGVRSGTCYVFGESGSQIQKQRWRDGGSWSSSR